MSFMQFFVNSVSAGRKWELSATYLQGETSSDITFEAYSGPSLEGFVVLDDISAKNTMDCPVEGNISIDWFCTCKRTSPNYHFYIFVLYIITK